jgi:hypothetical protein
MVFLWLSFFPFVPRDTSALIFEQNFSANSGWYRYLLKFKQIAGAESGNCLQASNPGARRRRKLTLMRSTPLLCLALAALLTGCAVEGVVVEKNSRPFPFVASVGMDGIYKFKLRNSQGHIASQMVTPEVFFQYQVGDYFNDLQPAKRSRVQLEEVRTVRTVQRVAQHTPKRSKVARAGQGKKFARAHHGKKIARAHHARKKIAHTRHAKKKRTPKAQVSHSPPATIARLHTT